MYDLQYDEIYLTCIAGYVWCVYSCGRSWSVCEVFLLPYVDAVVAVTMMCVLFVLDVSM